MSFIPAGEIIVSFGRIFELQVPWFHGVTSISSESMISRRKSSVIPSESSLQKKTESLEPDLGRRNHAQRPPSQHSSQILWNFRYLCVVRPAFMMKKGLTTQKLQTCIGLKKSYKL